MSKRVPQSCANVYAAGDLRSAELLYSLPWKEAEGRVERGEAIFVNHKRDIQLRSTETGSNQSSHIGPAEMFAYAVTEKGGIRALIDRAWSSNQRGLAKTAERVLLKGEVVRILDPGVVLA